MINKPHTSIDISFFQESLENKVHIKPGWEELFLYHLGNLYVLSDIIPFLRSKNISDDCKESLVRGLAYTDNDEVANLLRQPNFSIGNFMLVDLLIGSVNKDRYYDISTKEGGEVGVREATVAANKRQLEKILGNSHTPLEIPQTRTLNFYYRENEGDHPEHFDAIISYLYEYVSSGKSKIWTHFRVITRDKISDDLLNRHPNISIEYKSGPSFRAQAAIFGDTISLNHGSLEGIPGTHHIVGTAISLDEEKTEEINPKNITMIDLFYYGISSIRHLLGAAGGSIDNFPEVADNLPIEEVLNKIKEGVRRAEQDIKSKIQGERQQVHDIMNP